VFNLIKRGKDVKDNYKRKHHHLNAKGFTLIPKAIMVKVVGGWSTIAKKQIKAYL
jgi:hypothetical protein